MLDNLRLELTNGMTLTPADTAVHSNTEVWFTQDGTAGGTALTGMTGNFTTSGFLTRDGTNSDIHPNYDAWRQVNPGTAASAGCYPGADLTKCYGYLYNFYTAVAGTATLVAPNDEIIAQDSICPANWHLPEGGLLRLPHNELSILSAKMAGFASDQDPVYLANYETYYQGWQPSGPFRGVFSGRWTSGLNAHGDFGYSWASNHLSLTARSLTIGASYVNPTLAINRSYGLAVRCVATGGDPIAPDVTFDGAPATAVVQISPTELRVTVPVHATGTVDVTVDIDGKTLTLADAYTYQDPMTINSITPDEGTENGGTNVTISGTNIGPDSRRMLAVDFGTSHTLAVDDGGDLFAWGYDYMGQVGDGSLQINRGDSYDSMSDVGVYSPVNLTTLDTGSYPNAAFGKTMVMVAA
jgi:hypothetical protein